MIVVMEMSTGKIIEDEFGRFEDEVLNAEWLPPQPGLPELQLGLQEVQRPAAATQVDPESYLDRIYSSQE
jgi:hypothetical protein